jgi:hypothetical protein
LNVADLINKQIHCGCHARTERNPLPGIAAPLCRTTIGDLQININSKPHRFSLDPTIACGHLSVPFQVAG